MSTPSASAPLTALKQIPPSPNSSPLSSSANMATLKRAISRDAISSFKKQKLNATPVTSTPTTPSAETHFKIPIIPTHAARALTPSTSTVACSSSPPRIDSSSPTRAPPALKRKKSKAKFVEGEEQHVQLLSGKTLIFGRHRYRPLSSSTGSASTPTDLRMTIPTHLRHLLTSLDIPAEIIHLSANASHASRVHAAVEYVEDSDIVRVLVIGQNGLKIDGKRILSGQRVNMPRKDFVLDFYGARVNVSFPHQSLPQLNDIESVEHEEIVEEDIRRERLFSPTTSEPQPSSPGMSLPPSSPPLHPAELDHSSDRASSPLSAAEDEEMDVDIVEEEKEEVETVPEKEVKAELIENIAKPISRKSTPQPQAQEEIKPVPADVDLPALLASTVVFSGSSKLSLPDMVKHMLESQPSLRTHGDEAVWRTWCGSALEENPMFGKVQRHGKDSSGHPLLPHYFYNPDLDPDTSRAKELGGLVRPLRSVQRGGGKAIDWRPVGSGRRRYW